MELNDLKVTMLFPIFANDGTLFSMELWDWWVVRILAIGAYHEFFTRGAWEGQLEYHRCVTMILETEKQLPRVEAFLREARERFEQEVMYLEVTQVHFRLI